MAELKTVVEFAHKELIAIVEAAARSAVGPDKTIVGATVALRTSGEKEVVATVSFNKKARVK